MEFTEYDQALPGNVSVFKAGTNGYTMRKLAFLGGDPTFTSPLHVGRPNIGSREQFMAYVHQSFDNRWLTNSGPLLGEFEKKLCGLLGVKHCILVCNATLGLEIAIRALGMKGEVIVPSFTFVATPHALSWQGITPVFADIDPQTHTLDLQSVEQRITPRTTGIIGVHLWGRPCEIEVLKCLAEVHNLKVLYDAGHAFGCSHQSRMIGNFGDAEVFSFHATKFFNTFEGGAITTNNDELAARLRAMGDFGFTHYDQVESIGINAKMSEIAAAMGLTNLQSIDEIIAINRRNYHHYQQIIADIPGLSLNRYNERERCNYQYIVIEVDALQTGVNRDTMLAALHAENVLARRYFWPGCHRMEPYRALFPEAGQALPHTERVAERVLVLPTGTAVEERDIDLIGSILRSVIEQSDALVNIIDN